MPDPPRRSGLLSSIGRVVPLPVGLRRWLERQPESSARDDAKGRTRKKRIRYGLLVLRVPAALALCGLAWLSLAGYGPGAPSRAAATTPPASGSRSAVDWLRRRRQLRAQGPTPAARFALAETLALCGQLGPAWQTMGALAPPGKPGYEPAHMWQARKLLEPPRPRRAGLKRARLHLLAVLPSDPESPTTRWLLAAVSRRLGELDECVEHLKVVVRSRPEALIPLFDAQLLLADRVRPDDPERAEQILTEARDTARRALPRGRGAVQGAPRRAGPRVQLARLLATLGELAEAQRVLEEGRRHSASHRLQVHLARVHVLMAAKLERGSPAWRRHVEAAIALRPVLLRALDSLSWAAEQHGELARWARPLLAKLSVDPRQRLRFHTQTSGRLWAAGERARALEHMQRAYQLTRGKNPNVLNDLAYMLAHTEPPDLERALKLVRSALAARPGVPAFRDTRGRILLKLGRAKPALPDLLAGLPAAADPAEHHARLAECYAGLKMTDLEQAHRAAAAGGAPPK